MIGWMIALIAVALGKTPLEAGYIASHLQSKYGVRYNERGPDVLNNANDSALLFEFANIMRYGLPEGPVVIEVPANGD